jgi:hypothetical protein
VTTKHPPPQLVPATYQRNAMQKRQSERSEKYDDRERKIASAIKDLKEHPDAKLKHVATVMKATDRLRMVSCTTKGVIDHFKQLYDVIHRYHIDPEDFWKFAEKRFMMGQGGKQNELIITRVDVKQPRSARRIKESTREWVTLIECCSAGGKRLPAYYIYAGTAHFDGWHQGEIDPDTAFYFTHNGWTKLG